MCSRARAVNTFANILLWSLRPVIISIRTQSHSEIIFPSSLCLWNPLILQESTIQPPFFSSSPFIVGTTVASMNQTNWMCFPAGLIILHSQPHTSVNHQTKDSRWGWGKSYPAPGQSELVPHMDVCSPHCFSSPTQMTALQESLQTPGICRWHNDHLPHPGQWQVCIQRRLNSWPSSAFSSFHYRLYVHSTIFNMYISYTVTVNINPACYKYCI